MRCGDMNGAPCDAAIDIAPLLKPQQTWQSLSIDLRCYQQLGVDFSRIAQSFSLESRTAAHIEFANVELVPGVSAQKTCP
jgi:beta-glucosidase